VVCNKLKLESDAFMHEKEKRYMLRCGEKCEAKRKLENDRKASQDQVDEDDKDREASTKNESQLVKSLPYILVAVLVLIASIFAFYYLK
jgi:hypothetical protein